MSEENLPKGWKKVKIKDITTIIGGGTPSTSIKEYYHGDIPWLSPVDLSGYNDKYIAKGRKNISTLGLQKSSARLLPRNSVLFSSRAPIGYVAIAKNEITTNQGFKSLIPSPHYDPSFAYYFLKHRKDYIESQASGTTFKEISGKKLGEIQFPLPPLPEQQRIVAKLDTLFGHLDILKEKLDRIPKLLKSFRQQALTKAVTGGLTKEWREGRNLHNTSELEDEILEAKELLIKKKKLKKEKKLTELSEDQKLMTIPSQWLYTKLGKLTAFINGDRGNNYPNRSEYVTEDGVPFINTGHIEPDGSLDISSMNYITEAKYESLSAGKIRHGDLVYCLRGATLGKTAVITQFNKGAIASSLVIIRPFEGLNNWYLYYFLTSSIGRKYIKLYDNGSAQPNLSAESVRNYVIGLPSIEEQEEIVSRVDALFELADKIEIRYQSLKARIDQLPQAILAKAFRGELVEQEVKEYGREAGEGMEA